jgi:uncharacterized protein YndB with AHSA1/START domain
MMEAIARPNTQEIVVEEVLPHSPAMVWKVIANGDLIKLWLMPSTGFAAVKGTRFTFQTTPGGEWDGVIHCEVLDAVPDQRLVYSWKGGHPKNVGYGATLDTLVTFTLTAVPGGTKLRLVHAGFAIPANDGAYKGMSEGWKKIVQHRIGELASAN